MNTNLQNLKESVERWMADASQKDLLAGEVSDKLEHFNAQTPASLFDAAERPLVVGFFGGTGVGKSTLLNRLAGEDVARTGVERPTSREVTLYLHSTVKIAHLPKEYPIGQIKSAFHNNAANREILWIDMPDFDSVESENRHLVNDWLPHIDTLVYVVSPERYRDDNGWRLLLEHGGKHAWVFVINHWDRGTPAQREDFRSLLAEAGLEDPHVFCTDSGPEPEEDEFEALRNFVQSMSSANTIAQLESRGILMRVRELRSVVELGTSKLASSTAFAEAKKEWDGFWDNESAAMLASIQWKYPLLTAHYAVHETGFIKSIWQKISGANSKSETPLDPLSIDGSASTQALFEPEQSNSVIDDIQELVAISAQHKLPSRALRNALQPVTVDLQEQLNASVNQARDAALANPGTPAQRFLGKLLTVLTSVLPVLALSWAGYRIVSAFYQGGSQPAQYLGSNFAINAVLLVGLSWLLPFILARKFKPSHRRIATKAMQQGASEALLAVRQKVHAVIDQIDTETQTCAKAGSELFESTAMASPHPVAKDLQRVLIEPAEQDQT